MSFATIFRESIPVLVAVALLGSCSLDEAGKADTGGGGSSGTGAMGGAGGFGGTAVTGGSGGVAGGTFGGGTSGISGSGGTLVDATDIDVMEGGDGPAEADATDGSTDGSTWQPPDITNCVLWLDASDASAVVLSGSSVQTWQDKCAGTAVTGAGNAKPAYAPALLNGMAGVRFDGIDDSLELGGAPKEPAAYVLFFVLSNYKGTTQQFPVWSNRQLPAAAGGTVTYFGLASQRASVYQNAASPAMLSGLVSLGAQAHLLELSVGSSGRQLVVDGSVDIGDSGVGTATKLPSGLLGSDGPNNQFGAIDLFELVFYDRELTVAERDTVRSALKAKWALP